MIDIEFEEPLINNCECCGNEQVGLTRFVYRDHDAFAIYYIDFTRNHAEKVATGIISIGDWDTDDEPKNRFSFPFKITCTENNFQISLIDRAASPWQEAFLGNILDRNEALNHPWIKDVFHLTDHIIEQDLEVRSFFL